MTVTILILLSAVVLAALSITALFTLLKSGVKYTIGKISKTGTIDAYGNIHPGMKYASIVRHSGSLVTKVEMLRCYQRPTSNRWFRCDTHAAMPIAVSNLLNRELRDLIAWKK